MVLGSQPSVTPELLVCVSPSFLHFVLLRDGAHLLSLHKQCLAHGRGQADRQAKLTCVLRRPELEACCSLNLKGLLQDCWVMAHDFNKVPITVSTESEPKARPQQAQCPFGTSECDCRRGGGNRASPPKTRLTPFSGCLPQSNSFPSLPWHNG